MSSAWRRATAAWLEHMQRDKDACVAVMMLCEVAAYYKQQGKTLWDAMVDMYEEYGYYKEGLATMTLKGIDGAKEIQTMMTNFRENPPKELGGFKVLVVRDYKADVRVDLVSGEKSATGLPSSTFFTMSWKITHGAAYAHPVPSRRSNFISA